ncbi:DUF72 domain-containing protein [Candidatus Bathyarchaeota archaeon]|nr:DUF72 domain-containing protein [Candidatus Bathyarchaeota archaeon]MBS7627761.1 DUF72 domain-containing protein [Candidatus Bathyarchaeota archaeon]
MGEIKIGCSGWSYDDWIGPLYKSKERKLFQYSQIFDVVEVNSTFYEYPSKGTVLGWLRNSKRDLTFTAKLPKVITHEKLLSPQNVEEDLKAFLDLLRPIQVEGRLGCLLAQLPPKFSFDLERLESFLKILPRDFRFAVEFREASWLHPETFKLLKNYDIAYTIVDEPLLPPEVHVTTDIAYIRWHGKGQKPWYFYRYEEKELEPWVSKVKDISKRVKVLYGLFNNHFRGYAVENSLQLLHMLGKANDAQTRAKREVEAYRQRGGEIVTIDGKDRGPMTRAVGKNGIRRLTDYLSQSPSPYPSPSIAPFPYPAQPAKGEKASVKNLLRAFMEPYLIDRCHEISDEEIIFKRMDSKGFEATIRQYRILVDTSKRTIFHDCPDWSRRILNKDFCKHLGRIFLSMEPKKASEILEQILKEKDNWSFLAF